MRKPKDIKIGNYTLEEILERHQHWLNKDCEKWEYMCANLSGADLRSANLSDANLCHADLHGVDLRGANLNDTNLCCGNLRGANLTSTNLHGAYLCDANLSGANLYGANLSDANLTSTNLHGAYLSGANLSDANLSGANLSGAYFCDANLSDAYLYGANLSDANLSGANLYGAYLSGANLVNTKLSFNDRLRKGIKLSEPIIGWKKCKNGVLVKLEIPRGAIVFSINNKKCRTDKAKVLEIIGGDRAYSNYKFFSYYVGDVIEIFDFNCEYNVECAKGIHFFRTKEEAENY